MLPRREPIHSADTGPGHNEPMSIRHLDTLFSPASVAVFGASLRPSSVGATVWRNLRSGGYTGRLYPVNPSTGNLTVYRPMPVWPTCPRHRNWR
jgi:acetyltransferase